MKAKPRGASETPKRHQSFIRYQPAKPGTITGSMGSSGSSGQHLTEEQINRAQEVAGRLRALFPSEKGDDRGALTRLEKASSAAGYRLKQQTISALLNNRQCGYQLAQQLMAYAATRGELSDLPRNYILDGAEGAVGTERAPRYALLKMRYRAKGVYLDTLINSLPGEFLDFTAKRDPDDPDAATWDQSDWYLHVSEELVVWKRRKSHRNPA